MYPSHHNSPHHPGAPNLQQANGHADYGVPPPGMQHYTPSMQQNMLPAPPRQQHQPVQPQRLSVSSQRGDRIYTLIVEQQPDRARMCGFGDKDRRPITPPPCVRLQIRDAKTGQDIDVADIDAQHFILNVDLWDAEPIQEVNLVRHSNTSPSVSISMATTTSYPPPPEQTHHMVMVQGPPGQPAQYRAMPLPGYYPGYAYQDGQQSGLMASHASTAAGMFTRNLIGSVTVSAATLQDLNDKTGFWFVLQDLSVRTEGSFRLKMSFIDVGSGTSGSLNTGHCPVLASVFSEPFTVWSAKKFPGVKESTTLSKCFATQGVKIPIRKDGAKAGGRGGGGDEDDD